MESINKFQKMNIDQDSIYLYHQEKPHLKIQMEMPYKLR